VVEYWTLQLRSELKGAEVPTEGTPVPSSAAPTPRVVTPLLAIPALAATPPLQPEFVSPSHNAKAYLDADNDDVELGRTSATSTTSSVL
jgi:hypothetical protein